MRGAPPVEAYDGARGEFTPAQDVPYERGVLGAELRKLIIGDCVEPARDDAIDRLADRCADVHTRACEVLCGDGAFGPTTDNENAAGEQTLLPVSAHTGDDYLARVTLKLTVVKTHYRCADRTRLFDNVLLDGLDFYALIRDPFYRALDL